MHSLPHCPPDTQRPAAAFSLLEVVVALGIFSFGIVGLLGLIVVALETHQSSKEDTVLAQIKQRLTAEIVLTDGAEIDKLDGFSRSFDVEGRELPTNDVSSSTVYRARIILDSFTPPGATEESESLQRAVLFALRDPTPGGTKLEATVASGAASAAVLVSRATNAPPP